MGMFERLRRLFRANVNDLIRRAEDPEKMLSQLISEMNEQLADAKRSVATAIAEEKRLERQVHAQEDAAVEWERRAIVALRAGKEELAREAVVRRQKDSAYAEDLRDNWEKQRAAVEDLKTGLRTLQEKISDAERKKSLLVARHKRAQAQKRIHEVMSGLDDRSAFEAFEQMAQRVDRLEEENKALEELNRETGDASLEEQFAALERPSVDAELEDLRRKAALENKSGGNLLGSGAASEDAVDVEIERMKQMLDADE